MQRFHVFLKITSLIIVSACLCGLAACTPYVSWQEEVKLNDGRTIVVEQKKRTEGMIAREAWLTIKLKEFDDKPIVWHENLIPIIVNFADGKLYVIGTVPTGREARQYGCLKPGYIPFVWEEKKWVQIPFEKIPRSIYKVNMLLEGLPPPDTSLLTLDRKNSTELNGDNRYFDLLELNQNYGGGC